MWGSLWSAFKVKNASNIVKGQKIQETGKQWHDFPKWMLTWTSSGHEYGVILSGESITALLFADRTKDDVWGRNLALHYFNDCVGS